MRWIAVSVVLVLAFFSVVGCKQQCFLTECDYDHYRSLGLPANAEYGQPPITPEWVDVKAPATVDFPERPIRYLTLNEAIAIALERGGVGSLGLNGTFSESLVSVSTPGRDVGLSDNIRVLALDPAMVAAAVEASLSKFDAVWNSSMTWQKVDEDPGNNVLQSFQNGDKALFSTGIAKPLPTGGVAGITFSTDYTLLSQPPSPFITNPSYRPRLQFSFQQPLLQGFGVEINQLRPVHPGSLPIANSNLPSGLAHNPSTPLGGTEGILIARLRFDQQRTEFERQVQFMVANVEAAYWNLYGAYWNLYASEQAVRQAYEAWRVAKAQYDVGRNPLQKYAQVLGQYETFREQRLQAIGSGGTASTLLGSGGQGVLEAERQLRGLLGLSVEDGTRLVPVDTPTLAPYQPDWNAALNEAMAKKPELVLARQQLKARQLQLINEKNQLLPDLRFLANYDINALGKRLDGDGTENAFANLASDKFNSWAFGFQLNMPIGYREQYAALRVSRLQLAQSYATLRDQERKTQLFLGNQYRRIQELYEVIKLQRAARSAYGDQLRATYQRVVSGADTPDVILEPTRFWADALRQEYNAVVAYNIALAGFEFGKGSILEYNNIYISEGALPECAQKRAVEHERERAAALVVRERALPVGNCTGCNGKEMLQIPDLPTDAATPIPTLFKDNTPVPEIPAEMLAPTPLDRNAPSGLTPVKAPAAMPAPPGKPMTDTATSTPGPWVFGSSSTWTPRTDSPRSMPPVNFDPLKRP